VEKRLSAKRKPAIVNVGLQEFQEKLSKPIGAYRSGLTADFSAKSGISFKQ
jgi:hypothetical protein